MKLVSLCIPLSLIICIFFTFAGLSIKNYKEKTGLNIPCHESSIATIFGMAIGGAIFWGTGTPMFFDPDFFFYLVLPPIIFSAGYSLKRKRFFRYGGGIALFGIAGTIINFGIISFAAHAYQHVIVHDEVFDMSWTKAMLLGSILSASDEVAAMSLVRMKDYPRLGALIFGEGVLNDALCIVLFKSLDYYSMRASGKESAIDVISTLFFTVVVQLLCSSAIGLACGLANARILKQFHETMRRHPIHQTSLVILFGLLAYSIAESVGISGILTLFVAAVTLAHYSWHSLHKAAQISTKLSLSALSDIAEGFAFAYVGLSMWEFTSDDISWPFCFYMLFFVVLARFITVLFICFVLGRTSKDFDMPLPEQIGLGLGGVVRGCLCWAQGVQVARYQKLVTTTLFVVMSTTLICGTLLPIVMPILCPPPSKQKLQPLPKCSYHEIQDGVHEVIDEDGDVHPKAAGSVHARNGATNGNAEGAGSDSAPTESTRTSMSLFGLVRGALADRTLPPVKIPDMKRQASDTTQDQDHDSDSEMDANEVERESESAPLPQPWRDSKKKYSLLYVLWVRFDEHFMKRWFGGSAADEVRTQLLQNTQQLTVCNILAEETHGTFPQIAATREFEVHSGAETPLRVGSVLEFEPAAEEDNIDFEEDFIAALNREDEIEHVQELLESSPGGEAHYKPFHGYHPHLHPHLYEHERERERERLSGSSSAMGQGNVTSEKDQRHPTSSSHILSRALKLAGMVGGGQNGSDGREHEAASPKTPGSPREGGASGGRPSIGAFLFSSPSSLDAESSSLLRAPASASASAPSNTKTSKYGSAEEDRV